MKFFYVTLLILSNFFLSAQELIKFQVETGKYDRMDCPITVRISQESILKGNYNLQVIEHGSDDKTPLAAQLDKKEGKLYFVLKGFTPKNTTRKFSLVHSKIEFNFPKVDMLSSEGSLQLSYKNHPILNYQYDLVYPPKGIDSVYKKSGYIHPLWTPGGEVLTRIQPSDHLHHYGVWGPWTKTKIDNRNVDFWNLGKGEGTVLFKKFISKKVGSVFSEFTTLQEHIDFGAKKENRVAINEHLEIRAWNLGDNKPWLIDYSSEINSPLKEGILFDTYHYGGGIAFRATELWQKNNISILTSENKNRANADGSSAKWVIIEGTTHTKSGKGGILFMSHKENKHFPEPMRLWPSDVNGGKGDLLFEFCPIRNQSWKLDSHKNYELKYRMLVYEGIINAEQAEIAWQGFANPPTVFIETK
ncbi:PmoA family protein [Maribacter sp. ANRC-HE7]|uniref:PmoA family protein n=1 Tax=Maribacter aquimaris TaxID=2737171 RepID=A0ABR7UYU4_9FLAO|nr:PmoA family protein [Maribacter aquimaris]MBD0777774.1 PmoA family protein [Maribacter aquimaris]